MKARLHRIRSNHILVKQDSTLESGDHAVLQCLFQYLL
jgi:hypothetical protein